MKRQQYSMKYKMRKVIGLFSLIVLTSITFAQTNNSNSGNNFYGNNNANYVSKSGLLNNWYFGLNAGATGMMGTLRDKSYSWAVGSYLGKQLNSILDIQANFLYGKMQAEGFYGGLNLSNDVNFMDASLILKLKLKDIIFQNSPNFLHEIYLLGGAGLTFYDSKVINTADSTIIPGTGVGWDPTGTIKTNKENSLFIPLGMGLIFNIDKSGRYFLTTEFTYRYSNDNRLDGDLNPTHPTHYTYTSLGLMYKIGTNASSAKKIIADDVEERVRASDVKTSKIKPSTINQVRPETKESGNGLLNNWYFGLNAGATTLLSTLRDKPYNWAFGFVLGKQINSKLGIQANLLNGKMHSEGIYEGELLETNVNFTDVSLLLKLNLNDFVFTKSPKILRELYFLGGGGITFFNSKVSNTADASFVSGVGWTNDTLKTNRISTPFLPLGLGMSFNLGNSGRYFLTTEFIYRYSGDNKLDGGLTAHAANYTYASLGLVYNIGKSTVNTQQITADVIEERAASSAIKQVRGEIASTVQEELKPIKEELSNQSSTIKSIQADVKSRIDALNQSITQGVVTTRLPDGSMQATPISQMSEGAVPSIASIYFAFNSLYLTPDMQREIAVVARMMKKNRRLKCEISGNASNVGSPDYNLLLSRKRAQAVATFLSREFGIDINRVIIKSNGITDPLAKNLHKINRRVDMQLFW